MKILCVVGTRPEVIKMAPVILALRNKHDVCTVSTGQHREMLDQAMHVFGLTSDVDLGLMVPNQQLSEILSSAISSLSTVFNVEKPDMILGQGDTTTALAAATASYFNRIKFGHVEAGLRTGNYDNPWPEEMNRVLISRMSTMHFCPTQRARDNLFQEGIVDGVFVTGNTVIDSLLSVVDDSAVNSEKTILVTVHRRENFGEPLEHVLDAILTIVDRNPEVRVVVPVHLNPNVRNKVHTRLVHERIRLCEPMEYKQFAQALKDAYLVLTDSGGVQEEAPSLGTPVLVLRDFTERPESIEVGSAKLVGTNKESIVAEVEELLNNEQTYTTMSQGGSPYGDGKAAIKIVNAIEEYGIGIQQNIRN